VECLEGRALLSSSSLVHPDASGHLVYVPDAQGNIIPDFSNVGYQGGIVPLPGEGGTLDVPVRATVKPQPGPADARIQAAINFVSRLPPDATGFRGAVLLEAGEYDIADHIEIRTSGVVLRGQGNTTVLRATGTNRRYDPNNPLVDGLVRVQGVLPAGLQLNNSARPPRDPQSPEVGITDVYVPVGARRFHVTSTAGFKVGQAVIVHRPSPENWIEAVGMHDVTDGQTTASWKADSMDLDSDPVITQIDAAPS